MFNSVYTEIIKDSFLSHFILTFSSEFTYFVVLKFSQYSHVMATISALLGSSLGLFVSFLLFYLFAVKFSKLLISGSGYEFVCEIMKKYGFVIMAVSALPDIAILASVFFGLVRYKIKTFIFYLIMYRVLYYLYILYM